MNCQEVKEKLSYYFENDLPEGEKTVIQQHLSGCSSCREELKSLSKVIGAVKNLPEIEAPTGFSSRVMARIREKEGKKVESAKGLPLFGFRGFAYGFVVLLVAGIIYTIFQIEKPAPIQLVQSTPPVVKETPERPMGTKKEESIQSKPETDRVPPAPTPQILAKTAPAASSLTVKSAPSIENRSEPIQSSNRAALRAKKKEALPPVVEEKKAPSPNLSAGRAPLAEGIIASNELTGLAILQKSESHLGDDQSSTVTLRLLTKQGDEKKIVTKRYWKNFHEKDGMSSKTLFFTDWPPDARGTGFLIWNYSEAGKMDDLWLYLPSLRQIRHVSSRGQDDAFMGSDLTFGDMGQRRLEEDNHKLLREEPCRDEECYVVESVSKDKEGVYSKKIRWITKKDFVALKIEYYDRKGELFKTQKINWQEVSGVKAWENSVVVNVQTQHKTIFEISDLKINTGLSNDLFKEKTLKNGVR